MSLVPSVDCGGGWLWCRVGGCGGRRVTGEGSQVGLNMSIG